MPYKPYQVVTNVVLAALWLFFAYSNIEAYMQLHRLVFLLFVLAQTEFAVLLLARKTPTLSSKSPYEYIVAFLGSFFIFLYRPNAMPSESFAMVGDALVYIAVLLEIFGFLSLGRSTGIVPANRGVKTKGAYRFVRHPIYSASLFLCIGYFIGNPSLANVCILILVMAFQVLRIQNEEKLLMRDAAYMEYATHVKWKLVPFIY